jgi:dihydroneopterin triphosphate diphosphatase
MCWTIEHMAGSFINPLCVSVYVIHSRHNGNMFLLLQRSSEYLRGTWQMVSGGVKEGEKAYQAAIREVCEETGLIPDRLYNADAVETFYMTATDQVQFVPVFVAFIDTMNIEVQLNLNEHDNYEWVAFDVAQDRLIFSEQKRILSHVRSNFIENDPNPIHLIQF